MNRAGLGPCSSKYFLQLLACLAPPYSIAMAANLLPLPLSRPQLLPTPAHLWPLESGSLALSAACLSFICSVPPWLLLTILKPFLCFQDFRKYEEGFDPYSMVRGNSPALEGGCSKTEEELELYGLWGTQRAPMMTSDALFCKGSI